jgi:hypothetical protein
MTANDRRLRSYQREIEAQREAAADPYPAHTAPPRELPAWADYLCLAAIWLGFGLPIWLALTGP